MNTNEFEHLMKSLEAGNSGYMCFDRKEDMLFLVARIGRQCQLVDKRDKHVVELVDKDGRMVAFHTGRCKPVRHHTGRGNRKCPSPCRPLQVFRV